MPAAARAGSALGWSMSETAVVPTWRRRLILALLLPLVLGLAGWGGVQLWGWHELRAGRAALEADDLEAARAHLDNFLRVRPCNTEGRLLAAQAARRADDLTAADFHLTQHDLCGGSAEARAQEWALLQAQRGELAGVESYLRELVSHPARPESTLALEALGKGYSDTGQNGAAMGCLTELVRRQPEHFQGHLVRGRVLTALAEDSRALEEFETAVKLRPRSFEARLERAAARERAGRLPEALADYTLCHQQRPTDSDALLGLARQRGDSYQLEEADALLAELLAAHPGHSGALTECARVALRRGEAAHAEELVRQVTAREPGNRDAFAVLLQTLVAQDKSAEAEVCTRQLDRIDAARAILTRSLETAHNGGLGVEAQVEAADALLLLGRRDEAVRLLEAVLARDAGHTRARDMLARAKAVRQGEP